MVLCLPFHLAADVATRRHGKPGWSSVRGHVLQPMRPADIALRRLLSLFQFVNNHAMCFAGHGSAGVAFCQLSWVQLNAFTMTLRKKQLLTAHGLIGVYALLSVLVTVSCLHLTSRPLLSVTWGAALLWFRTCGVSKYALWAGTCLLTELTQMTMTVDSG